MKTPLLFSAAVLGLVALLSSGSAPEDNPPVGSQPPEIDAEGWINHLGTPPTLASLKGQAVLIEFWATW
jgi:hypothetical protein